MDDVVGMLVNVVGMLVVVAAACVCPRCDSFLCLAEAVLPPGLYDRSLGSSFVGSSSSSEDTLTICTFFLGEGDGTNCDLVAMHVCPLLGRPQMRQLYCRFVSGGGAASPSSSDMEEFAA